MKINNLLLLSLFTILLYNCKKETAPDAANHTPSAPVILTPANNATDVSGPVTITWTASTDQDNDPITYSLLLGTDQNNLMVISSGITGTSYTANDLDLLAYYYLKIEATDNHNATSSSSVSEFTTSQFGSFTDSRDGNIYGIVKIGDQTWMRENLRYDLANESWDYDNNPSNSVLNGKLYSWSGISSAAPAGWHLPTDEEWKTLETELGMPASDLNINNYNTPRGTDQGTQLQVGGTSGMDFYPAGYRSGSSYFALGNRTYIWVNTTLANGDPYRRRLVVNDPSVYRFTNPEGGFAISIRLIKD